MRAGWMVVIASAVFATLAVGCATTPPAVPVPANTPTPEIPAEAQRTPQASAQVIETVPAPSSEVKSSSLDLPMPPPPVTADRDTREAFKRALTASANGDPLTAERELKNVLRRNPKLDYAHTNLGVIYERQALLDQAEKEYKEAIALKPDQEAAWDYLTRLSCRRGKIAQLETQLRSNIAQYPAALGLRTALVVGLICQNQLEAAAGEAKKVLKSDERNVRAMQLLAQIYYREKKYELAKMVLENAKAVDASDAATLNALGLVNLALKQRTAALENFKEAASLRPDFAEARNNFGAMLNEAQDYEAASRELEAAVNAAPDFASARLNLGNAYRGRQEYGKAISQYKQVLRMKPELPDTYFNLAILHLDSDIPNLDGVERLKTAISYFDQFKGKGGKDERVEQYVKDANKGIEKEERRKERERKDQLKKAEAEKKASQPAAEAAPPPAKEAAAVKETPAKKQPKKGEAPAPPAPTPAGSSKLSGDDK